MIPSIPNDVVEWLREVFRECNIRITEKLSNSPNLPEESLDLTWIEHLSRFSSPVTLASSWIVKVEAHYLGGLRHFYGKWEVADIAVLVFIRRSGHLAQSKVALLQSKRLYPSNKRVIEERKSDYDIGLARIADPEDLRRSFATRTEFRFHESCVYGALMAKSNQAKEIDRYERENTLSVYYQLYNPWTIPFVQRIPLLCYARPAGKLDAGTRIVPARLVHKIISRRPKGYQPTLRILAQALPQPHSYGWPLEHFIVELLLGCTEGSGFDSIDDDRIQTMLYRRSGAIAAAIAITIEGPRAAG